MTFAVYLAVAVYAYRVMVEEDVPGEAAVFVAVAWPIMAIGLWVDLVTDWIADHLKF